MARLATRSQCTFEPLFSATLLPLEVGDAADRAVLRHDDGLAERRLRLVPDIDKPVRLRRLREDRRRVAGDAEIERAGTHGLQHLRTRRELRPDDGIAGLRQCGFQQAQMLQDDQRPVALVADADRPASRGLGRRYEGAGDRQGGEVRLPQKPTAGERVPVDGSIQGRPHGVIGETAAVRSHRLNSCDVWE